MRTLLPDRPRCCSSCFTNAHRRPSSPWCRGARVRLSARGGTCRAGNRGRFLPPRDAPSSASGRGTPGVRHGQWTEDRVRPRHGRAENSAQLPLRRRRQRLRIASGDGYGGRARCRDARPCWPPPTSIWVASASRATRGHPRRGDARIPGGLAPSVEWDGLLGWNAIRELRITLDNDRRVLLLEPPRHGATSRSEFVWVGKPFVRARAGNGLPLALFLDTAYARSVIAQALAGAAGFRGGRNEEILALGVGGTRRVRRQHTRVPSCTWVASGYGSATCWPDPCGRRLRWGPSTAYSEAMQ